MTKRSPKNHKPPYFLGIDNGLTVAKAVIFSMDGQEVGSGMVRGKNNSPHPHWVERDLNQVWGWVSSAIRAAIKSSQISPSDIKAVGVTAHGDGLYLVDKYCNPIREGIVSLDSRAMDILDEWSSSSVMDNYLSLAGQYPFEGNPAPLLTWIKRNEPQIYENIGWILSCKDWIRYKLIGEINTDFTEASTSFSNVDTQEYDEEIFDLLGLSEMVDKVPPAKLPIELAGEITSEAARETGLMSGTPVAIGVHDVHACSIGSGCVNVGQVQTIAGTWSINQVITDQPSKDPNWLCRSYISPGLWVYLSCSPASATNLEWFVQNLCSSDASKEIKEGGSGFDFINHEVSEVLHKKSEIIFLPFLYGSPFGALSSSCFVGIRGWHERSHLLKAIYEGVVFNHRFHIEALRKGAEMTEVRLTGGGAKSAVWSQLFSDALNLPVLVADTDEAGALGAAICAGVASGSFGSLDEAVNHIVRIKREHEPNYAEYLRLSETFSVYSDLCKVLNPIWEKMN